MLTFMLAWCPFPSLCFTDVQTRLQSDLFCIRSHLTWEYKQLTLLIGIRWIIADYQWSETLCHFQCRDILFLQIFSPPSSLSNQTPLLSFCLMLPIFIFCKYSNFSHLIKNWRTPNITLHLAYFPCQYAQRSFPNQCTEQLSFLMAL